MKFNYYITDIGEGMIRGTNNKKVAENLADSEDFFVLDATTGTWILSDGSAIPVKIYPEEEN